MTAKQKLEFVCCDRGDVVSSAPVVLDALFSAAFDEYVVFPGFCDVHVHFREPGFSYKETIKTGSQAAAAGGYTDVCTMPNLKPVPDSLLHLLEQKKLIEDHSCIHIYPYSAITVGQQGEILSDMENLASGVIGFSDDGRGVQSEEMMRKAMLRAKKLGKIIVAHCEVNSLLNNGYIHDGQYALRHGHRGISSQSEYAQVERDLKLAKQTGCAYHVCHISTKESVELIRQAKAQGVDVTCETAPHYLVLDDEDLQEDGRFKMNPPIRSREDKRALLQGIIDGTIDMIATDHAPHSVEEKSRGLEGSLFGIVGLETAFSVLYTKLVKTDIIRLEKLIELLTVNPRKRFGISDNGKYCIWDLRQEYCVDPEKFLSKGRSTPFSGWQVNGKCIMTVCDGKIVYQSETEG